MPSTKEPFILEICANSLASAIAAQEGGAQRVELCDNLYVGGTTPSAGCMVLAREYVTLPIHVLIRPRGGDFLYSDLEFEIMKQDIQITKDLGMNGVVFGILNEDGTVDKDRSRKLLEFSRPLSVTFHRAFDMTPDPFTALHEIIELGFDRILTSGQTRNVMKGLELLSRLVQQARDRILIMAGGGIREGNLAELMLKTKAHEYHASVQSRILSRMAYRNPNVSLGGIPQIPEYEIAVSDVGRIRTMVAIGQKTWADMKGCA